MIALDTNVLVRYLVEDDKAQSARAARVIGRAIDENDPLFVSELVLCETVWVLASCYEVTRVEIVEHLRQLLRARHLKFADGDRLGRALTAFAAGKGDFADYMIREHGRAAGATATLTFDKKLLKEPGFAAP